MGRHKFGGGAVRCEVCPNKVTHQNSIVVGRKESGTARVIHKSPKCQQKWKQLGPSLMADWPENRKPVVAPNTPPPAPTKPAREKRPDPPQPPAPAHKPTPVGEESSMSRIAGTPPAPRRYNAEGFVALWKPEAHTWVTDYLKAHPYKRGIVTQAHAILVHTMPHLLLDAKGRTVTYKQLYNLMNMVRRELNGKAAVTPQQETPVDVAPTPKLVPVNTGAIIAENNVLRKAVGNIAKANDAVSTVIKETLLLLDTVTRGPVQEEVQAAYDRLVTLADLVTQH